MSFIIVDNKSGNIFDIQDSRKSRDLEQYFRRYSKYERDKVEFISTDFYSGYIFLAKKLFNYNINNGIIEGTNNLIKVLKRISFGFKKIDHFTARIFLIKGIIKG